VSSGFAESHVEEAALAWLSELGYGTAHGLDIGPDGANPERANYGDVLLVERLRAAIAKLNPTLSAETRAEVLAKLTQTVAPSLVEENRRQHRYMIEGAPIEIRRADGSIGGEQVRLIDFANPEANDWLVVNQYTVEVSCWPDPEALAATSGSAYRGEPDVSARQPRTQTGARWCDDG
jgi:type I restriction enzyme R subunit